MRILNSLMLSLCVTAIASADDWPQYMGPKRDDVWRETGIVKDLPAAGPKIVWRVPIAGGYAGPSVANGKVFIADYVTADNVKVDNFKRETFSGNERVLCLDEATGKEIWHHEYPVKYTVSYPAGPRCTPNVNGGKVYTLGAEGDLLCLDAATGKVIWSKNLPQEYHTKTALWGYAGHPLIDGKKLIAIAGGEGSFVVAFDKDTGAELWRGLTSPEQGYASPEIIEHGGKRQLVLLRPGAVTSLDPETGHEYWSVPYKSDQNLVSMAPILWHDYLFVGSYQNESALLKLAADGTSAESVWTGDTQRGLSPVIVQPTVEGDILYGFDHNGHFYAMKIETGERLWNTSEPVGKRPANNGTAFIVRQADRYWLFTENGDLVLANLTPEKYEELGRAHILEPTNDAFGRPVVWCPPAFADGQMFVRNDKECVCVSLKAE
jgi:outer membrane protein assembly factor BamB